jgi:hypothetical protein
MEKDEGEEERRMVGGLRWDGAIEGLRLSWGTREDWMESTTTDQRRIKNQTRQARATPGS